MKHAHIVAVRWKDACTQSGWLYDPKDAPLVLKEVVSVGLFVKRDKEVLQLMQNESASGAFGELINIPLSQIHEVCYCKLKLSTKDKRRRGKYRFSKKGKGEPWRIGK